MGIVMLQQFVQLAAEFRVIAAGLIEIGLAPLLGQLDDREKDVHGPLIAFRHDIASRSWRVYCQRTVDRPAVHPPRSPRVRLSPGPLGRKIVQDLDDDSSIGWAFIRVFCKAVKD